MAVLSILAVVLFSFVLSIVEIPKMLKQKLYKDLGIFCLLLILGTVLAVLKSLDVEVPNPSDLIAWIYSPLAEVMKSITK